ncbi:MAG: hypothetical protein SWJ54_15150 [Cyanobacteriota bacterium]|nr:hypothetical protein [Cyanobacteriota bacterium]
MASEPKNPDRLHPLQFLGVVVAATLVGGFILSLLTSGGEKSVQEVERRDNVPILPEYPQSGDRGRPITIRPTRSSPSSSGAIVLVPRTQTEVDCVLGGGGVACFDENYRPNYPSNSSRREWAEWERRERQDQTWFQRLFN